MERYTRRQLLQAAALVAVPGSALIFGGCKESKSFAPENQALPEALIEISRRHGAYWLPEKSVFTAPDFEAFELSGKKFHFSDFKGSPTFFTLQSSYFGISFTQEMIDVLSLEQKKYASENLRTILVTQMINKPFWGNREKFRELNSPQEYLALFSKEIVFKPGVLIAFSKDLEPTTELLKKTASLGFPATFLIDSRQKVRASYVGLKNQTVFDEAARALLDLE